MATDRLWKSVFGPEKVNRSGLAVVPREDRGFRANVIRQSVVDTRYSGHHLLPSKLISVNLRQRTELPSFDRRLLEVQRLRISNVSFDRQHRYGDWSDQSA